MIGKALYTIHTSNLYSQIKAEIQGVIYNGEKMRAYFCENEKGIYVIICKYRKNAPSKTFGHWNSGSRYFDIYFRKNFATRQQGNDFYRALKKNMTV